VTNHHVVDKAQTVEITTDGGTGKNYSAKVIGIDSRTDVALIPTDVAIHARIVGPPGNSRPSLDGA